MEDTKKQTGSGRLATFNQFFGSGTVRGAVIGGASAALVTIALTSAKPATASATVLLGPLATIQGMIDQYMGMMNDYVDQWVSNITGLIDDSALGASRDYADRIYDAMQSSSYDQAAYHARGDAPYMDSMNEQLSLVRNSDGSINAAKAAKHLAPPGLMSADDLGSEEMTSVWEHALLVTGDKPIPEVRDSRQDMLVGTEYEYGRMQAIQGRLLAQDAIQRYPLEGPRLSGYREHLGQYQSGSKVSGMTPGQLMAAQLDVSVKVQAASAVDQLESSLRQERMLGALLAQEIKPQVRQLRSEQP